MRPGSAAEVPRTGDACLLLPNAVAAPAGPLLRLQVRIGVALAQVTAKGEGLPVLHHRQADVDVTDHLGHAAAEAVGGLHLQRHLPAHWQSLPQVAERLLAVGTLGQLGGVDAGDAHRGGAAVLAYADRVAVTHREHGGAAALGAEPTGPPQGCECQQGGKQRSQHDGSLPGSATGARWHRRG